MLAVALWALACPPARAGDETLDYRVGPSHENALPDSPLRPPLRVRWAVAIGSTQSNIVIAGGRLLFVNDDHVKAELTALDVATGQVLWSRPAGSASHGWWGLTYENGRVFAAHLGWTFGDVGHLQAVAADTGALAWETYIPEAYGISAPPTVADGTVYVPAENGTARLYALGASDGAQRWVSSAMLGGSDSSPTLDSGNAYLAYPGPQVHAIDRASGQFTWSYHGCCSGGGGATPVLHHGLLFHNADGNLIHDAATGRVVGAFPGYSGTGAVPAFSGDLGLFVPGNRLVAIGDDGAQRWVYAAFDPYDTLAFPLIAGGYAYVKEGDRFVTAVDLATGLPAWCVEFIPPPGSDPYPGDVVGPPHAGDGILVVSIGYGLVALESGGGASGCPSATAARARSRPPDRRSACAPAAPTWPSGSASASAAGCSPPPERAAGAPSRSRATLSRSAASRRSLASWPARTARSQCGSGRGGTRATEPFSPTARASRAGP